MPSAIKPHISIEAPPLKSVAVTLFPCNDVTPLIDFDYLSKVELDTAKAEFFIECDQIKFHTNEIIEKSELIDNPLFNAAILALLFVLTLSFVSAK